MSFDGLLDIILPTPSNSVTLVFGRIDAAGKVFLEPGNVPIVPPPPSLAPLTPNSRFVGTMQGVAGKPQSLLIIGIIGGDGNPPGAILEFAGLTAPEGYLLCQGQAVSRTTYARLYDVIGVIYGAGDGSTTFNLPDRRRRVGVGFDPSSPRFSPVGSRGGEEDHALTSEENGPHTHAFFGGWGPGSLGQGYFRVDANSPGALWDALRPSGEGRPHNNMPPYEVTNYIIVT